VASTSSALHTVSTRYATALLATAESANVVADVERDMMALQALFTQSSVFRDMLSSPVLSKTEQATLLGLVQKNITAHDVTIKFLNVLTHNRRVNILPHIISSLFRLLAKKRGEMTARVTSAAALTPEQQDVLRTNLSRSLGAKIILDMKTDPSLLGGLVVTVGSTMVDDSVKGKLDQLKKALQTQANQNHNMKEVG
jgi:F-type H+-transporting ATPase subunit delta